MQYKHPKTCISVLVGIVIFVIQTVLRNLLLPLSSLLHHSAGQCERLSRHLFVIMIDKVFSRESVKYNFHV